MHSDTLTFFMFLTAALPWVVVVGMGLTSNKISINARRILTPLLWLGSVVLLYLCWNRYAILHPNWQNDHIIPNEDISALVLAVVLLSTVVSGLFACFIAFEKQLER